MRTREFPVLEEADRVVTVPLDLGLPAAEARVLAYLLQRQRDPGVDRDPADRLELRVGTGLGRDASVAATTALADRGLVDTTTVADGRAGGRAGRDRKAWVPTAGREATITTVHRAHARQLAARGRALADGLSVSAGDHDGFGDVDPTTVGDPDSDARVSVALNWEPNAIHFPLLYARRSDASPDRHIDVELSTNRGSGAAMAAVRDGEADVGVVGPATLVRSFPSDDGPVPLALLYQRSMVVVYALQDHVEGPFDGPDALAGRRVAVAPDSETGRIVRLFLSRAGVAESVEYVPVSEEERSTLLAGEVDAAAGIVTDPIALRREDYAVASILVAADFPLPGPAIVASRPALDERPAAIESLLARTMVGWAAGRLDPERVVRALEGEVVGPLDETVLETLIETFGTDDSVRAHGWGWQTEAAWDRMAEAVRFAEADR